jgi:hypothetical protein
MLNFKSSKLTKQVAQGLGIFYMIYAIFSIGIPGLLLSLAVGLIVMGTQSSFELAVAASILVGLLYKIIPFRKRREGFQTLSAADVTQRINQMKTAHSRTTPPVGYDKGNAPMTNTPEGVLGSTYAEGFANILEGFESGATSEGKVEKPAAAASGPASADIKPAVKEDVMPAKPVAEAATADKDEKKRKEKSTSGFQGNNDGLFRLGEMPSESTGGPHIDASSTILSAISSLKPDQLRNMTDDTRKLLDTQKSLLGMLETMKPMITDGQELLSSFNGMFGKQGGANGLFKLG